MTTSQCDTHQLQVVQQWATCITEHPFNTINTNPQNNMKITIEYDSGEGRTWESREPVHSNESIHIETADPASGNEVFIVKINTNPQPNESTHTENNRQRHENQ